MGKKRKIKKWKKISKEKKKELTPKNKIKEINVGNEIKEEQEEHNKDFNKNILSKKKVAISYKKLKQYHENKIKGKNIYNLSLEQLKVIASNFDLDPLINFRLLSLLKEENFSEYNKYITKYRYTLNYEDAKKLKCFEDDENELKNECLKNFDVKIDNIKSISKIKLFNFLFSIMNLEYDERTFSEEYTNIEKRIINTLELYKNKSKLIFKVPNNLGNYELQYYTYLGLLINYLYTKIIKQDDNNNNEIIDDIKNFDLKIS